MEAAPELLMGGCLQAAQLNANLLPANQQTAEYSREASNCAFQVAYGYGDQEIANFEHMMYLGTWSH
jgi:hypothetical protein